MQKTGIKFGWRFRLANWIMNDYLRNYLAVGLVTLSNAKKSMGHDTDFAAKQIEGFESDIRSLFKI